MNEINKYEIRDGYWTESFWDGKPWWYKGNFKNGKPEGYWEHYSNGRLFCKGKYKKGNKIGCWEYLYETKKIQYYQVFYF